MCLYILYIYVYIKYLKLWENYINENSNKDGVVLCNKTLKHKKGGLNFFKGYEYNYSKSGEKYSVSYDDGRFATFGKDMFEKNFEIIS
jgi:hypothetical protein|tara:strand:- start:3214 stop:3477 length:264 start_codon:yes stop_codon:yes gene_type:complete